MALGYRPVLYVELPRVVPERLTERHWLHSRTGVGAASDQANCADHNYQNYRNHHGILGNILTVVIEQQTAKRGRHGWCPF